MPNNLGLSGAQSQKQVRFAPIFTSRFFSGLWTNRSPLRDATTSRIVEKFYGQAGDALIAGTNVEITTKLTLARRPGTTLFDSVNTYNDPDRFYEFKLFNSTVEEILIMIDQANALYSLFGGVRSLVFNKTTTSQGYMQSVGNILYYGDGAENKKYLQTLFTWTANTAVGTPTSPFYSTWFSDANGKLLQLVGTIFPITSTSITAPTTTTPPTITIGSSIALSTVLATGTVITFPATMSATYLENQSATVLSITGMSMVVTYPLNVLQSGATTETVSGFAFNGGTPTTGNTQPVATDGASYGTPFGSTAQTVGFGSSFLPIPGLSIDGTAMWVSRTIVLTPGSPQPTNSLDNWGIPNTNTYPITFPLPALSVGNGGNQIPLYTANGTVYATNTLVTDPNGNIQKATVGGTTSLASPAFQTILGQTTVDNSITWTVVYVGALSAFNGGWRYSVALVNTLDNTVSNGSPLSVATGNFIGSEGINILAGTGINTIPSPIETIDAQVDYVAIFRTTDGQAVPFLIPSANGVPGVTLPLSEYMQFGYTDTTPDTGLDNLVSAAIQGENTPPAIGAINLTFHLGSIWYSIGNVVYWTSGPTTPVGNGLNGTNPLNTDSMPSLVKRLVPTTSGMLVFTISDVYIIQGNNTPSNPIQPAIPLLPGIGLSSYNALDQNGALIGLFTTDSQFLILDPSSGTTYAGFPIGDQLLLDNGTPGQSWNPASVYVAWHVQGMDQGWYLGDGVNGWYRLIPTPSPEGPGYTWAPFATLTGGVNAIQSVEITPGVHRLLLGPTGTGFIQERDLNVFTDNGTPYPANATVGSVVAVQPGQVAEIAHIVTDSVRTGSPLTLGILVDEALPYYTGPIDLLTNWVNDPPNLKPSKSLWSQRFYLSELQDEAAALRHMQIQIIFNPSDTTQNEILTLTVFGAFSQEI